MRNGSRRTRALRRRGSCRMARADSRRAAACSSQNHGRNRSCVGSRRAPAVAHTCAASTSNPGQWQLAGLLGVHLVTLTHLDGGDRKAARSEQGHVDNPSRAQARLFDGLAHLRGQSLQGRALAARERAAAQEAWRGLASSPQLYPLDDELLGGAVRDGLDAARGRSAVVEVAALALPGVEVDGLVARGAAVDGPAPSVLGRDQLSLAVEGERDGEAWSRGRGLRACHALTIGPGPSRVTLAAVRASAGRGMSAPRANHFL